MGPGVLPANPANTSLRKPSNGGAGPLNHAGGSQAPALSQPKWTG
jgi:hypothetical protein